MLNVGGKPWGSSSIRGLRACEHTAGRQGCCSIPGRGVPCVTRHVRGAATAGLRPHLVLDQHLSLASGARALEVVVLEELCVPRADRAELRPSSVADRHLRTTSAWAGCSTLRVDRAAGQAREGEVDPRVLCRPIQPQFLPSHQPEHMQ